MDQPNKNIWKKVLKGHLVSLAIVSIILICFVVRSGNLSAWLLTGVVLFLAAFWFIRAECRQYKRESPEVEIGKES